MELAVIGAGSTYTPELISGLARERDRVGAALLGLDEMTALPGAAERVRGELEDAFIGVEHAPAA